ncbi:phospholipase A2 inhibitor and Ly6/PLAUR domain-containing protein-like [Thamnophis elegans]|uniref:phospholipase A2 inhibitor and Ly6/PLAUR domain-containing protein-like n=1 Tax=Thamnophis elegans TaxID=35005 RepID=UPI001378DC99|nr:phospholipase A2 inhibitor and Ly6/PLAUR domain-containing protein-like [Thamnophis elegans]
MTLAECEPDQTHCSSLTLRTTFSTPPVSYTTKTCVKPEEANDGYFTITSVEGRYFEVIHNSCQSDGCNIFPSTLPRREELKPNGYTCPGSYTKHGDSPQPDQPVLCLGNENQCGDLDFGIRTLGYLKEKAVTQGCVTSSICSYPMGETQMGNGIAEFNRFRMNCTSATQTFDMMFFNM